MAGHGIQWWILSRSPAGSVPLRGTLHPQPDKRCSVHLHHPQAVGPPGKEFFRPECRVAGCFDIQGGDIRQPEQIVRKTGPNTAAGWRMPPVHHVAFFELVPGGDEYLAAGDSRIDGKQRQYILKLVAETKCSAGLVKACAAPDAAGKRLVEHPAVEDQVCGWFRGLYLHRVEQLVPEICVRSNARLPWAGS